MSRYLITLSYDGTRYHGWQRQPNGVSVQQRLEEALSTILRQDTEVVGAGRTDAGVHAAMMTAHFDYPKKQENPKIPEIPDIPEIPENPEIPGNT